MENRYIHVEKQCICLRLNDHFRLNYDFNSKHFSCKNDSTCKFLRECLFQYCQRTQKPSFARLYDEDKLVPINGTPMIIYDRNKERIR